jgi:hypothetical protein
MFKRIRLNDDEKTLLDMVDPNWRKTIDYESPRKFRKKKLRWRKMGTEIPDSYISNRPKSDLQIRLYFVKTPLESNIFELKTYVYDPRSRNDKLKLKPEESQEISFYHHLCIVSTMTYDFECFSSNSIPGKGIHVRDINDALEPNNYLLFKKTIMNFSNEAAIKAMKNKVMKKEITLVKERLKKVETHDTTHNLLLTLKREYINNFNLKAKLKQMFDERKKQREKKRERLKGRRETKKMIKFLNIEKEFHHLKEKCQTFLNKLYSENGVKTARYKADSKSRLAPNLIKGMRWVIKENFKLTFDDIMKKPHWFFWVRNLEYILIIRNVI